MSRSEDILNGTISSGEAANLVEELEQQVEDLSALCAKQREALQAVKESSPVEFSDDSPLMKVWQALSLPSPSLEVEREKKEGWREAQRWLVQIYELEAARKMMMELELRSKRDEEKSRKAAGEGK